MKALAIPFIGQGRAAPPRTEETIYEALKPALAGLTDINLTAASGPAFYGTNIQFRDSTVSAGVHPAIMARASAAEDRLVTLLVCHAGTAIFSYGGRHRLALRPGKAGLLKNRDWEADCSDYGGFVIRVSREALARSMSLAFDRDVGTGDIDDFDLRPDSAYSLRHSLQALEIAYRPELAATGLFDDHLVATAALCIAAPGVPGAALQQQRLRQVAQRACELVRKEIKSPMSVAELARALNVSERYLQLAFQSALATSPKQWMLHEKLSAARQEMLANPSIGLSRLAEDYHFSSPAHFSRAFRKMFGASPGRLRDGEDAASG